MLVVSHYLRNVPCKKNYNYIFEHLYSPRMVEEIKEEK